MAGKLLDQALVYAREGLGCEAVYLSVEAENDVALRLYQSRGFEVWGREPRALRVGGECLDEVHLWREL